MFKKIGIRHFLETVRDKRETLTDDIRSAIRFEGSLNDDITLTILPAAIKWARAQRVQPSQNGENFCRCKKNQVGQYATISQADLAAIIDGNVQDFVLEFEDVA